MWSPTVQCMQTVGVCLNRSACDVYVVLVHFAELMCMRVLSPLPQCWYPRNAYIAPPLACIHRPKRYCKMCFTILHRKGNRSKHSVSVVPEAEIRAAEALLASRGHTGALTAAAASPTSPRPAGVALALGAGSAHKRLSADWFRERCRFIPIRLQVRLLRHLFALT